MCLNDPIGHGNMGLMDIRLALKWVQKHISKFGGDPNQVTVAGVSSGAASIGHLLLSDLTRYEVRNKYNINYLNDRRKTKINRYHTSKVHGRVLFSIRRLLNIKKLF